MKWVIMSNEPEPDGVRLFGPFDNEDDCIEYLRHHRMVALVIPVTRTRKLREKD